MSAATAAPGAPAAQTAGRWAVPAARLVLAADAPRSRWLGARRAGIGGSDASTVAGVNPWSSPYELWCDKLGLLPTSIAERESEAMEWGRRLEPVIAGWFTEHTGIATRRAGLLASRARPWQLASVDRLTADGGILEIKTTSWRMAHEWDDDQVADHAEVQTQHYLAVTGRSHAHVVALVDGRTPLLRRVERDEELIDTLIDLERRFWHENVTLGRPPTATATALPVLRARFASTRPGSTLEVPAAEVGDLLARLSAAKVTAKAADLDADAAEAQLRALFGDAETLTVDEQPVATLKGNGTFSETRAAALRPDLVAQLRTTRDVLDVDALKRDHPDVYANCRARVLRPVRPRKTSQET